MVQSRLYISSTLRCDVFKNCTFLIFLMRYKYDLECFVNEIKRHENRNIKTIIDEKK